MVFGSIDTPFPLNSASHCNGKKLYGSWVAAESFYQALMEYGTFEEYHFFVDPINIPSIQKKLSQSRRDHNRFKIIPKNLLPSFLQKTKYTIFFTQSPILSQLAYLRRQFSNEIFPLCGVGHTISLQQLLEEAFFKNMISSLFPCDSIICTSTAQLRAIQNLNHLVAKSFQSELGIDLGYRGRLDKLPLGIDVHDYGKIARNEARDRLGLPPGGIIILYFGRFSLSDKMDLHPLLLAFKEVWETEKRVVLLLAGNDSQGNYSRRVEEMANDMRLAENVKFIRDPSRDKSYLIYSASDIFVSPSDNVQESFGLTNLEAMASGLPVVASDWNGYKDTVIHNKTGFRIPTYWARCDKNIGRLSPLFQNWELDHLSVAQSVCVDVQKMTEYLLILVKNRALRLRLGENARIGVLEKYDWRVLIPQYERLWRRLFELSQDQNVTPQEAKIFVPEYFRCFRHYASEVLNRKKRIGISARGIFLLKTKKLPRFPEEAVEGLSQRMIFIILLFLFEAKIATLEKIEKQTIKYFPSTPLDNIRFHVLWLLKKDLIRIWRKSEPLADGMGPEVGGRGAHLATGIIFHEGGKTDEKKN